MTRPSGTTGAALHDDEAPVAWSLTVPAGGTPDPADVAALTGGAFSVQDALKDRDTFLVTARPGGDALAVTTLLVDLLDEGIKYRLEVQLPRHPPATAQAWTRPCGHIRVDDHTHQVWALRHGPHLTLAERFQSTLRPPTLRRLAGLNETDAALLHHAYRHPDIAAAAATLRSRDEIAHFDALIHVVLDPLPENPTLRSSLARMLADSPDPLTPADLRHLAAALTM